MEKQMNYLKDLLKQKEESVITEIDKERVKVVRDLLQNNNCFFELDMETSLEILGFIGVPNQQIEKLYFELISPEAFNELPKIRITGSK